MDEWTTESQNVIHTCVCLSENKKSFLPMALNQLFRTNSVIKASSTRSIRFSVSAKTALFYIIVSYVHTLESKNQCSISEIKSASNVNKPEISNKAPERVYVSVLVLNCNGANGSFQMHKQDASESSTLMMRKDLNIPVPEKNSPTGLTFICNTMATQEMLLGWAHSIPHSWSRLFNLFKRRRQE